MSLKEGTRVALAMRRGVVVEVDDTSFALKLDNNGGVVQIKFTENWLEESMEVPEPKTLREHIAHAINRTSSENGSDTPDFILADYLASCLRAFDTAVNDRATWYGRRDRPWQSPAATDEDE